MESNELKKEDLKKKGEKANKEVDKGPLKSTHKNQYASGSADKKNTQSKNLKA